MIIYILYTVELKYTSYKITNLQIKILNSSFYIIYIKECSYFYGFHMVYLKSECDVLILFHIFVSKFLMMFKL